MAAKTCVVVLDAGQDRSVAKNRATKCGFELGSLFRGAGEVCKSFRQAFVSHYPAFRDIGRATHAPALLVFAVDSRTGRLVARGVISAKPGRVVSTIIGRHSGVQVMLPEAKNVALRHLAILVHPPTKVDSSELFYSVRDLRTGAGFHDEHGRPIEALGLSGPALFRLESFYFFVLPIGDATDFPDDPNTAFDLLPERVYLEERLRGPSQPLMHPARIVDRTDLGPNARNAITLVGTHPGPAVVQGQALLAAGEIPAARLVVTESGRARSLVVGEQALSRGLLIGRYDRCDEGTLSAGNISRVHLLVTSVGAHVVAVDLGSTNGTSILRLDGWTPMRCEILGARERLSLAGRVDVALEMLNVPGHA